MYAIVAPTPFYSRYCWKSEPVCRFELTDLIENQVVFDGHKLRLQIQIVITSSRRISNILWSEWLVVYDPFVVIVYVQILKGM